MRCRSLQVLKTINHNYRKRYLKCIDIQDRQYKMHFQWIVVDIQRLSYQGRCNVYRRQRWTDTRKLLLPNIFMPAFNILIITFKSPNYNISCSYCLSNIEFYEEKNLLKIITISFLERIYINSSCLWAAIHSPI
jgi:hypothetical protein